MKVDFGNLKVQFGFEDQFEQVDLRKDLGNTIRRNTVDIGMDELAKEIYFSNGEIEVPEEYIPELKKIVGKCYIVPVQESINQLLTDKK